MVAYTIYIFCQRGKINELLSYNMYSSSPICLILILWKSLVAKQFAALILAVNLQYRIFYMEYSKYFSIIYFLDSHLNYFVPSAI